jgi:hypothetical protein
MIDDAKTPEAKLHIEDPDAFTTPWNALQRFARVERGPLGEQVRAENNANDLHREVQPMPQSNTPDF